MTDSIITVTHIPGIKTGDVCTIAGVVRMIPSGRRWWQVWRPRLVVDPTDTLARFIAKTFP